MGQGGCGLNHFGGDGLNRFGMVSVWQVLVDFVGLVVLWWWFNGFGMGFLAGSWWFAM